MKDQAEQLREIMSQKKRGDSDGIDGVLPDIPPENQKTSNRHSGGKTRIITVTSGKGGVGKTSLSINLAMAFAKTGKKVVVMDADLGLANVNVMLNMIPRYNLYHVIKKQKTIKEILIELR